jgi:hypothetical protein
VTTQLQFIIIIIIIIISLDGLMIICQIDCGECTKSNNEIWRSALRERRSQWPRGLRRRSAAARLHGCLSVVSVVCCLVEVSATS